MDGFPNELVDLWDIACPECHSELLNKNGKYKGRQRFICLGCGKTFTSYSKSFINASKIDKNVLNDVVTMIIRGQNLKSIETKTNISYISLSKLRLKILRIFYTLNTFENHLYNHDHRKKLTLYIKHLQRNRHVLTLQTKNTHFTSKYLSTDDLDILRNIQSDLNIHIVEESMIENMDVIRYHDSLQRFLSNCRGIKDKYLNLYITFHAIRYHYSITEAKAFLNTHMAVCLKPSQKTNEKRFEETA